MRTTKRYALIFILLVCVSCAWNTGGFWEIERDQFLDRFWSFNREILAELKYDDSELNLETLDIDYNRKLFEKIDLTKDYMEVVNFIDNNVTEKIFILKKDTFIICILSKSHSFIACDNADTTGIDCVTTEKPLPDINNFYEEFKNTKHTYLKK